MIEANPSGKTENAVERVEFVPLKIRKRLKWAKDTAKFKKQEKSANEYRAKLLSHLERAVEIEKLRTIDDRTLQEIGDKFGISRERVRQILESFTKKSTQ